MAPQFTEALANAFEKAFRSAQEQRHLEVGENHLLRAILQDPSGYFCSIAQAAGLDAQLLLPPLEKALATLPTYEGEATDPQMAMGLTHKVQEAEKFAKKFKDTYIGSDHFFLAYWDKPTEPFASWKKRSNKTLAEIEAEIKKIRGT